MKTIHVKASKEYDIIIKNGALREAGGLIREACGIAETVIISDDTVYGIYGEALREDLESAGFRVKSYVFPHGEKNKNLETYGGILEFLSTEGITRSGLIAALGGGVTGDLAGFAAATYLRGIRFVQIPTTLLADVDSSVGGKTAVDLKSGKNQAGCFYQPSLVICDPETLKTLPEEEFRCGCAEVIKYAFYGNREFYDFLMKEDIKENLEEVIAVCVTMKRDMVEEDEFDTGKRMILNFGHTFGHAVEACSDFTVLHGQAVAAGMAIMTRAAHAKGYCSSGTVAGLEEILKKYGLPDKTSFPAEDMLKAALKDKKKSGSSIRIVVPESIGKCRIETIPAETLSDWMAEGGVE